MINHLSSRIILMVWLPVLSPWSSGLPHIFLKILVFLWIVTHRKVSSYKTNYWQQKKIYNYRCSTYLQVGCRLWKFGRKFLKFIACMGAFHNNIKLFEQTCTVPCFGAQNTRVIITSTSTVSTLLKTKLLWCRVNEEVEQGEDMETAKHISSYWQLGF